MCIMKQIYEIAQAFLDKSAISDIRRWKIWNFTIRLDFDVFFQFFFVFDLDFS